ncbi:MAG: hypothetical protein EA397_09780 [Deltaproteobacteria bacterium]|nr:MAG: hypothetical protein EA397_09780 [Deltaproteobacteria bacterium]
MRRSLSLALLAPLALSACGFNEGLIIEDMKIRILVPREAATRVMPNGEEVTDVRLIGPVYFGFYADVRDDIFGYGHPSIGPVFNNQVGGDAYPYGGSSLGDIRYPCLEFLVCKVVSGRYVDFDEMVEWFGEYYEDPIVDSRDNEVTTGEYIRQTCFERMRVTGDDEIRLTVYEDRNEDGKLDHLDLDFVENADGDFEAEAMVWQQEFVEGFQLWGWMDSPGQVTGRFNTCNSAEGFLDQEYDNNFRGGRPHRDLLNFPSRYIRNTDWVASEGKEFQNWDDEVVLVLDHEVNQ